MSSKDLFIEQRQSEMTELDYQRQQMDFDADQQLYYDMVTREERNAVRVFIFCVVVIVLAFAMFALFLYQERIQVETLQDKLNNSIQQNELLSARNLRLASLNKDVDLVKLLTVYTEEGVSDANNWVCVAILESGWKLDSDLMTKYHNPIGMGVRPYYASVQGADMLYAKYPSVYAQARDLKEWIKISPRKSGELFHHFLIRRGYNLNPGYFVDYNIVVDLYNKQS